MWGLILHTIIITVSKLTAFVNRIKGLNSLNKFFNSDRAEFIVIYGRRRIGKTELIKRLGNAHQCDCCLGCLACALAVLLILLFRGGNFLSDLGGEKIDMAGGARIIAPIFRFAG